MIYKKKIYIKKEHILKLIICFYLFLKLLAKNYITVIYEKSINFGDNLNAYLLEKLFDGKVIYYNLLVPNSNFEDLGKIEKLDKIAKTDIFFIGSILSDICDWSYTFLNIKNKYKTMLNNWIYKIYDYFNPLIIFGTGFILENTRKEKYIRNIKVIAVRGNITLQRFIRNGIKINKDVVLADPGILAPLLIDLNFNYINQINRIYPLCIIPHFVDQNNKLINNNIKVNGSIILNINEYPLTFIINLSKCKRVISSSLHGLIVSDSFGIPNMRFVVSDKIIGGDYKYNDYYSSYGINQPVKFDLRENIFTENQLYFIDSNYSISQDKIREKQCELLIKFPYKLNKQIKLWKNKMC